MRYTTDECHIVQPTLSLRWKRRSVLLVLLLLMIWFCAGTTGALAVTVGPSWLNSISATCALRQSRPVSVLHSVSYSTPRQHLAQGVHDMWSSFVPLSEKDMAEAEATYTRDEEHQWMYGDHPQLSADRRAQLKQVLLDQKSAFAYSMAELPGYNGECGDVDIKLTNRKGLISKKRHYSPLEYEIQDAKCKELLEAGVIEPCEIHDVISCATLPVKRDAVTGLYTDKRLCYDYRKVNSVTVVDRYPMPLAEELFAASTGSTWFSKLDLRSGFHQLPLTEEAKQITTFWWRDKAYRYRRLPFGLVNATAA